MLQILPPLCQPEPIVLSLAGFVWRGELQKEMRALNWISRPGVIAIVMLPNCGVFTKRLGVPRLVWFRALKNSPRSCRLAFSVRRKPRETARSSVCMPGPYTEFLPTLPNVKAAGVAKAAGLNHFSGVRVPGPKIGCPV